MSFPESTVRVYRNDITMDSPYIGKKPQISPVSPSHLKTEKCDSENWNFLEMKKLMKLFHNN